MVKALAESGLVDYEPRGGVRLSAKGEKLASTCSAASAGRAVPRRGAWAGLVGSRSGGRGTRARDQRQSTGEDRRTIEVPEVDPHGDPIPNPKGKIAPHARQPRRVRPRPTGARRARDGSEPSFLQFIDRHHLKPGAELVVRHRDDSADAVSITSKNHPTLTLGTAAATKILVEAV
jgi:DtxR family Mn-dependent transcriptional regulator